MEIEYQNKKLEELVKDRKRMFRVLGQKRATLVLRRIDDMSDASSAEQLKKLPGHYHELTGDRKGEWACSLDQPYRLIFIINDNVISIIEIVNYHGN